MDALTYLRLNWERLLRGERLSAEDLALTAFLSLSIGAALVPVAVSGVFAAYDEAKRRGLVR
ncbi:MAG: hypothetical protein ACE5NN_06105 [Candidatus Bathyarchaeia archaeon]